MSWINQVQLDSSVQKLTIGREQERRRKLDKTGKIGI